MSTTNSQLITVNTTTGAATQIDSGDTLTVGGDYEGFDCHFTALTRAVITRFGASDAGGGIRTASPIASRLREHLCSTHPSKWK